MKNTILSLGAALTGLIVLPSWRFKFKESQVNRYTKGSMFSLFVSALCLGMPAVGHASTILAYQLDGSLPVIVLTASSLTNQSVSFSVAGIDVVFLSTSEVNSAAGSSISSSTTRVTNTSGVSHILSLLATSQDFTLPIGPTLKSSSGSAGTYFGPSPAVVTFQAYADATNAAFGTASTIGLQTAVPTPGTTGTFDTGEATSTFVRGAGPYSLTIVNNLTLAVGASLNYASHEIVSVSTVGAYEPSTLSLLGLGLISLAIGKRRQARSFGGLRAAPSRSAQHE